MHFLAIVFLASFLQRGSAIPIDNGVEGDPEIECGADSVTVNFNVRNDFQGHVYVKGRFADGGECRTDGGGGGGRRVAGIKLAFTACGTKRERSLSPKGVFVSNTVVITFHPQFLTKVDRAYTIQCFYMEADKTVSQELEVSDITTAVQTQVAAMPVCRYDILEDGPNGTPVKFAIIGQQVYHKWTCETETVDMFCALIHSCVVDDGAGNNVQLLNENGCALDRHLLGNLEYQTDLMAGHEAHVFKYADKPALFFNCQITIFGKEPGSPCARPQCPEAGGPGGAAAGAGGSAPPPPPPPAGTGGSPKPGSTTPKSSSPRVSPTGASPRGSSPVPHSSTPGASSPSGPRGNTPLPAAPVASGSLTAQRRDQAPIAQRRDQAPVAQRRDQAPLSPQSPRTFRFRYARAVENMKENATAQLATILADTVGTWDVSAQAITTLEIGVDDNTLPSSLKRHQFGLDASQNGTIFTKAVDNQGNSQYCLQPVSFGIMMALTAVLVIAGTLVIVLTCWNRNKRM